MKRIMRELRIAAGASVVAAVGACNAVGPAALGIGPGSSFEGSTFGAWVLDEENPTISYVPVGSEVIVERMLAPLSADQTLLLRTLVGLRPYSEAKGQLAPVLGVPVGR
jgi:hypothetical protein